VRALVEPTMSDKIAHDRLLRLGVYNPANITRPHRADDVSLELANVDLLGVVGTARRRLRAEARPCVLKHAKHYEIAWGWAKAHPDPRATNRSCGVSRFCPSLTVSSPEHRTMLTGSGRATGTCGVD